ncbi:hypothetical protein AVEN_122839-1 [Araneus ventricosus]|uniref:DUF4817 domain-containing protein n=1 Tax=Araneus ventricosus TaxID=182803 RepID=A0A4Y2LKX5_ARAVE|nr:hypothetical protein AVEN_122839-1 [Araneus ventricosus]
MVLCVLLNVSTSHENFLLTLQNRLCQHTAELNHVWYKNHMDFMYYVNGDGTSYLFTRDRYYKKDVSAGLHDKADGPHTTRQTILKVIKRLRETGCVPNRPRVRGPRNVGRKVQPEYVLASALAYPQSSIKLISENCGLSNSRVWTILNESGAHPYRSIPVQGLRRRDAERRYTLIGPVFYKGTLTEQRYLELLQDVITDFVENLPLHQLRNVWFQHYGAPAHKISNVKQYLMETIQNPVIGYGGFVEWLSRSPDLTPLDVFLWGHIKGQVYATPPPPLQDLRRRITDICASVTPTMLYNVQGDFQSIVKMCI